MKQLLQIIALNFFGLSALQIILAIGVAVLLLQAVVKRLSLPGGWKATKESKELENDMWAIE